MNINENLHIEALELMGDILDEIKEIKETELTEAEILREFNCDPKD